MTARAKTRLYLGLTILGCAVGIELACAAFFIGQAKRFRWRTPAEAYTLTHAETEALKPRFDAVLGWRTRFETPFGERPRPRIFPNPVLSTFGDSFTFGAEVGEGESWQSYLSEKVGAAVLNFGISGHGTDQALLNSRSSSIPRTRYVSLGLILENINRVYSRYRKFYFHSTTSPYPKPRFHLENGQLVLLPNPLKSAGELVRLEDPGFIRKLGEEDYWFSRSKLPELRFPYSRLLFHSEIWNAALDGNNQSEMNPQPKENLWEKAEARDLMLALLDAFDTEAKQRGQIPFIVLSPTLDEVKAVGAGQAVLGEEIILAHCKAKQLRCLDGIALFSEKTKSSRLQNFYQEGRHLNAAGNQLFAELVRPFLTPLEPVTERRL